MKNLSEKLKKLLAEAARRKVLLPNRILAKITAAETANGGRKLTFKEFVTIVNPRYQWFKHCEVLGNVLQDVADGEISRLMIFMPPRHGKSEETSRLFSAYYLYIFPEKWVGLCSYGAGLAYTLSRSAKDNFLSAGGELRGDAKSVKQWQTVAGGGLWAAGVGGDITGKGFHLGIIDDPLKNSEEAASDKIREKQKEWYSSTFYTREEPGGGAIIFILTRWNEDDLAGWQLAEELSAEEGETENWHVVNLPAICEEEQAEFPATCTVEKDWRKPGEALCPERFDLSKLKRIASKVGVYFWNALFQQSPRPRDGGMFKRSWFKIVGAVPVGCTFVRYWDKAGSDKKGDYTAGVLMARAADGSFFVVDVVRGQWAATEREKIIVQTAELDRRRIGAPAVVDGQDLDDDASYTIWVEQEGGSGGKESATATVRRLAGHSVQSETVSGKKETRADPFAAQGGAGNVSLVRGDWNEPYLKELTVFPNGKNDDQVDASSGAFNKLALGSVWEWN